LVTCARWTGLVPTPVAEIADADWRRAMDVNVTGTFNCVRAVVPSMSARRRGRIVILSSATVTLPPARPYVHYLTTKAALIGMTRGLAKELGAVGITVNAVLPGSVETGVPRPHLGADDRAARAAARQSVPVPVRPEDVAAAIVFLVCDETGMITGQSITVDGGRSFL
ncbi:MAG: SDR family NAD(P)-dependent oxidoreductase, partial [Acetobacteraceae bacterium]